MTVTVYTKPVCKQCDLTKHELKQKGIPYTEESILDPANLAAAKELGLMSAPVVMAGDEYWAGFRPDKIQELAERLEKENK